MSNFIDDLKEINNLLPADKIRDEVKIGTLEAVMLPYYIDPDTMKLMVVLKREILHGSAKRTGIKMGITSLKTELPEDNPITIEEAFSKLDIGAKIQNTIPLGGIMIDPVNNTQAAELVLIQIEPIDLMDKDRGIVKQEVGKFEIGVVSFDDLLDLIQGNFIQDLTTRFILGELYIIAMEESNKEQGDSQQIGGNVEYGTIGMDTNNPISEEVDNINTDKNFGAIYK